MDFVLDVEKREEVGKQAAKRLRREGFVPGVVYGHGEETTPIKVPTMQISEFLKQSHGEAVSLRLKLGKKKYNAIIKAIERDPVTGDILHLDFQILHKGEKITVEVPIEVVGTPIGVKQGGILEHLVRSIEVRAIPSKLPSHIEIDVSELHIGDSIFVKDLKLEDVEILEDPEEAIVTVLAPRKAVEVVEEEEAELLEEEEAGEITEES